MARNLTKVIQEQKLELERLQAEKMLERSSMKKVDVNGSLAQAQQLDAERGEVVVELASAVEALRNSGDMLAKVSEE